jgi:hypothetical protein
VIGFLTILLLVTIINIRHVRGFPNSVPKKNAISASSTARVPTILFGETSRGAGDKDNEIAQLEAQLRRLKEEKEAEDNAAAASIGKTTISSLGLDSINDGPSAEEVPIAMFLSEGWKEKEATQGESDGGGGGILTSVLGAVALAVFLAVFSQVPIGQEDLSKYSVIRAPSQQIDLGDLSRARTGGGDL